MLLHENRLWQALSPLAQSRHSGKASSSMRTTCVTGNWYKLLPAFSAAMECKPCLDSKGGQNSRLISEVRHEGVTFRPLAGAPIAINN